VKGYAGYIPECFEWKTGDKLDYIDEAPIAVVEPELYTFIENNFEELPQDLLDLVEDEGVLSVNNILEPVNYLMILTDKERVLTVYTDGELEPVFKGRTTPMDERVITHYVMNDEFLDIEWKYPEEEEYSEDSLLEKISIIKPEYMIGLTRKERELKEVLLDCLFNLACSDNRNEVLYWYIEMYPTMYGDTSLKDRSSDDLISEMFDDLKYGWGNKHFEFGSTISRHIDLARDAWESIINNGTVYSQGT